MNLVKCYTTNQDNANTYLKGFLSNASSKFLGKSLTSEANKNYNYNVAMAEINSSSHLFEFTIYNKTNNNLQILLNNPEDKQTTDNLSKLVEEIRRKK